MIPVRALRLERYDAVSLNRQAFLNGEIFYDASNNTLRLFDGTTTGGRSIATQSWTATNFASLTAVTTNNATINSAIALKANIASPTFTGTVTSPAFSGPLTGNVTGNLTGNVTGNVTGNLTGNVTGNLTGNVTGNATSADTSIRLTTARTINGVSFDGTGNITVTANSTTLSGTELNATVVTSSLTSTGTLNTLEVAGNIQANANVVISTAPTQINHATNKKYVDARALAMSIAMS
jgi:hypothetical protein